MLGQRPLQNLRRCQPHEARKIHALNLLAALGLTATLVGSAVPAHATEPGLNGRIVFRRYLDFAKTQAAIFTVNTEGTKVKRVTHPRANVIDTEPDWSPDAKRIAFERKLPCPAGGAKNGMNNTCDVVYTGRSNGKGLKSLVPCGFKGGGVSFPDNCVGVDDPAWSPTGSKLAFQYNLVDSAYSGSLNVDAGIWIVNADGSDLRQITQRTPGSAWDFGPQWSPDGTKLVFYRADLDKRADAVFTVSVDGTGEFQVTPWVLGGGDHPDWSPDARWLLFRGEPGDGSSNVYNVRPDGTDLTNLTNEGPGGFHYLSSSFSPDGTMITTARTPGTGADGAADVFVMNTDGSNIRAVTKTRLWDSAPDWGPRR